MITPVVRREVEAVAIMVALDCTVGVVGRHLDAADRSPDHAESGDLDRDAADRAMFHPPLSA